MEILKSIVGDKLTEECGLSLCVLISQETGELEYIIYDEALKYKGDSSSSSSDDDKKSKHSKSSVKGS